MQGAQLRLYIHQQMQYERSTYIDEISGTKGKYWSPELSVDAASSKAWVFYLPGDHLQLSETTLDLPVVGLPITVGTCCKSGVQGPEQT